MLRASMPPPVQPPQHRAPCPHTENCPLYPQFATATLLSYWRNAYCNADYQRCARFRRAAEGQPVPVNLLPSGNLMKLAT